MKRLNPVKNRHIEVFVPSVRRMYQPFASKEGREPQFGFGHTCVLAPIASGPAHPARSHEHSTFSRGGELSF